MGLWPPGPIPLHGFRFDDQADDPPAFQRPYRGDEDRAEPQHDHTVSSSGGKCLTSLKSSKLSNLDAS